MIPALFDYARPTSLDEALALLGKHGEDAKLLAGGHSLIPAMKLRLAQPRVLIDLARVKELTGIEERDGWIAVGAMVTHAEVHASPVLRKACALLSEAAAHIGDVQVRNKGTIGGSLVHADPAADWPAVILALDAELDIAGPRGRRTVRATEFFVDLLQTAVASDEVLCQIRVRPLAASTAAYVKTEQKASGFALCGVAAVVDKGAGAVRIGVTGVAPTAYRATAAEQALTGRPLTPQSIAAAALKAGAPAALSDIHASAEYRNHLAQVNTRRALTRAGGA